MKKLYCIAVLLLLFRPELSDASALRVHFIAVGHGDAILIESGDRFALVDAGSAKTGVIVLQYLRDVGCSHLQKVIATHTHQDHIGAMPFILDSLQVDTVCITGMVDEGEEAKILTRYLQSDRWVVDTTEIGDTLIHWDDLQIVVLSPPMNETAGQTVNYNANSMVLELLHGQVKILLTADIDREREKWLIERCGADLSATVLKAAHHGSHTGNCLQFLKAVNPQITVISTGPSEWGYPSDLTVQRINENCPSVFRTDLNGTVIVESDGQNVRVIVPSIKEP